MPVSRLALSEPTGGARPFPSSPTRRACPPAPGRRRIACVERYGLVWVALEEPRWPLPEVPEMEDSAWTVVRTGPFAWAADASRQVENFTDFGHFAFVHPGLLGDPDKTVVAPYEVETRGHVLRYSYARPDEPNTEALPVFAAEERKQDTRHTRYALHLPYTIVEHIGWGADEGMLYFFASQPVSEGRCIGYCLIARNYNRDQPDHVMQEFERVIFGQDQTGGGVPAAGRGARRPRAGAAPHLRQGGRGLSPRARGARTRVAPFHRTPEAPMTDAAKINHLWTHKTQNHPRSPTRSWSSTTRRASGCGPRGHKLMDGFAGLAVVNVGHGRREIAEAIAEQTVRLAYYPTTRQFSNRPAAELADGARRADPGRPRLRDVRGERLRGQRARAADGAPLLAGHGPSRKYKVVSLEGGYHGATGATLSHLRHTRHREGLRAVADPPASSR